MGLATLPDQQNTSTPKERGDSLEKAVEHIFKVANFTARRNVFIAGYQIDVMAEIGDRSILLECKNYQDGSLTIRNLIHEWNSKNEIIKAHKVILVLAGVIIKPSDYDLAYDFNIELWSESDLTDLFSLSLKPDQLRKRLLERISLRPLSINERYRDNIIYLAIRPHLTDFKVSEEELCTYFNRWLRSFILTELQITETTRSERAKHIELFEGSKTRKGFLGFTVKRKEVDYWNTLLVKLSSSDILEKDYQERYKKYMHSLEDEYSLQVKFFKNENFLVRTRMLLLSRLYYATLHNQECNFKIDDFVNIINVKSKDDGTYILHISEISESQSNVLNWILTSDHHQVKSKSDNKIFYYWTCANFNEVVEKVYRVFTEYLLITEEDTIKDLSMT